MTLPLRVAAAIAILALAAGALLYAFHPGLYIGSGPTPSPPQTDGFFALDLVSLRHRSKEAYHGA